MKEIFEYPVLLTISFEMQDVITASGQDLPDQEFE